MIFCLLVTTNEPILSVFISSNSTEITKLVLNNNICARVCICMPYLCMCMSLSLIVKKTQVMIIGRHTSSINRAYNI